MSTLSAITARAAFSEYRIPASQRRSYELDPLVPIGLGGSRTLANLDPERGAPKPGFHQKDRLANHLHALVCGGKLSLALAQRSIASNWPALYKRIFGVAP